MKTTIHYYRFNLDNTDERTQYEALRDQLQQTHGDLFFNVLASSRDARIRGNSSDVVELETKCLFSNQWNTATERIFDWYEGIYPNRRIKAGHWLAQTQEMVDIRNNTYQCGYCGAMYGHSGFCDKCLGSEYLKAAELYLLRLLPISSTGGHREQLSDLESAELLPKYNDAQGLGVQARTAEKLSKLRQKVANLIPDAEESARKAIEEARTKTEAFTWLLDHLYRDLDNVIYYTHTGRFCFGWRTSIKNNRAEYGKLCELLEDFPFDYDIK